MLSKTRIRVKLVKDLLKNSDCETSEVYWIQNFGLNFTLKSLCQKEESYKLFCSFLQLGSLIQSCMKHNIF